MFCFISLISLTFFRVQWCAGSITQEVTRQKELQTLMAKYPMVSEEFLDKFWAGIFDSQLSKQGHLVTLYECVSFLEHY